MGPALAFNSNSMGLWLQRWIATVSFSISRKERVRRLLTSLSTVWLFVGRSSQTLTHPALYSQYFENEKHPSSDETLLKATADAGIPENEAKAFIEDRNEGMMDTKMAIREQKGNTDAVPYIIFEGKRRDFTLEGAKDIGEYYKNLVQVAKESK